MILLYWVDGDDLRGILYQKNLHGQEAAILIPEKFKEEDEKKFATLNLEKGSVIQKSIDLLQTIGGGDKLREDRGGILKT